MKTIKDVFENYRLNLVKMYDVNEVNAITSLTINNVCELSTAKIKAFPEFEISAGQSLKLKNILLELKTGKPIQYILGNTEFYGLPFNVNPSVLIPRPETEELVEWVINSVSSKQWTAGSMLDIGTGSGCIAISLKKNLPGFTVSAIDISISALKTAVSNAELNTVDVEFVEADILNFKPETKAPKFEIIISNPPYVTLHDKAQMHSNVTDFEPHSALFVPENDPLIFYKAIADYAFTRLTSGGLLFLEINESYGSQTVELLRVKGFNNIELRKDMSGRDRMIKCELIPR
ncbi:peptide chain release factor N(5)-glutamine methyltransferase [Mucilaginibacter xinganensis]|uniref:peptide chain release factor N(5)-glutamine methyltransferase n=1 Tax=Mucilaginibacter xinganensis TaxID=1234841 RepID=A0A223NYB6_9SPHI|nr:peptide chain release factor N(5)-glutamine methyltransferase [Mucilaginibacter xinganensis]ASU34879.1 protein-(glutamine-N5) methyltransferase, release factor-specific [Mucilaginibacter xinganensis]